MRPARERLARLAKMHGVPLRQSYAQVGKRALMAYQRYAHAKQFKRTNRALRSVRTYLGHVFRDIVCKTEADAGLRLAGDRLTRGWASEGAAVVRAIFLTSLSNP